MGNSSPKIEGLDGVCSTGWDAEMAETGDVGMVGCTDVRLRPTYVYSWKIKILMNIFIHV
jgi:hypothetical protein